MSSSRIKSVLESHDPEWIGIVREFAAAPNNVAINEAVAQYDLLLKEYKELRTGFAAAKIAVSPGEVDEEAESEDLDCEGLSPTLPLEKAIAKYKILRKKYEKIDTKFEAIKTQVLAEKVEAAKSASSSVGKEVKDNLPSNAEPPSKNLSIFPACPAHPLPAVALPSNTKTKPGEPLAEKDAVRIRDEWKKVVGPLSTEELRQIRNEWKALEQELEERVALAREIRVRRKRVEDANCDAYGNLKRKELIERLDRAP